MATQTGSGAEIIITSEAPTDAKRTCDGQKPGPARHPCLTDSPVYCERKNTLALSIRAIAIRSWRAFVRRPMRSLRQPN